MQSNIESQKICLDKIVAVMPSVDKYIDNFHVEDGLSGLCLFYCYLAKYSGDTAYYSIAERYFEEALEKIHPKYYKKIYPTDTYDSKLASFGKLLIFLKNNDFVDEDYSSLLEQIDETLEPLLYTKFKIKDFDMWSGALAHGHYYYYRSDENDTLRKQLSELVFEIDTNALKDSDGDYYWVSPTIHHRVYLGISHGSSMIIAFLSALHEKGIEQELCRSIILKAANFMLKHKRSQDQGLFPNFIGDEIGPKQFSLCYGDLGIGYGLLKASQVLTDNNKITEIAQEILSKSLKRTREDNLTIDASNTYGAAGLAYAYDKIYRVTKEQRFEKRASYWHSQIVNYQTKNDEFANFENIFPTKKNMSVSYSWGIAGIGISLMKSIDNSLPAADGFNILI